MLHVCWGQANFKVHLFPLFTLRRHMWLKPKYHSLTSKKRYKPTARSKPQKIYLPVPSKCVANWAKVEVWMLWKRQYLPQNPPKFEAGFLHQPVRSLGTIANKILWPSTDGQSTNNRHPVEILGRLMGGGGELETLWIYYRRVFEELNKTTKIRFLIMG
jgi:hypothetical protein